MQYMLTLNVGTSHYTDERFQNRCQQVTKTIIKKHLLFSIVTVMTSKGSVKI